MKKIILLCTLLLLLPGCARYPAGEERVFLSNGSEVRIFCKHNVEYWVISTKTEKGGIVEIEKKGPCYHD